MAKIPQGERLVITLTGCRNAGKSSLINALTGQQVAIVSATPGSTADPVGKPYELLPLGTVTFFDTAGLDDTGELGQKRVEAALRVLFRTDLALLVIGETGLQAADLQVAERLQKSGVPFIVAFNKADLTQPRQADLDWCRQQGVKHAVVSAHLGTGVDDLKNLIMSTAPTEFMAEQALVSDLIKGGDTVLLVVPIDLAAPKGRLILPQVQVIREVLDNDAVAITVKERELEQALDALRQPPALVITDSQVVLKVAGDVPADVPLTTFSTLFARYKGDFDLLLQGARQVDKLRDGDKILIAEACSHHVQADDIGTVKIPRWLRQYTGKEIVFEKASGHDFPENLEEYALVVQCGACMISRTEVLRRLRECARRGVPVTNYGLIISKLHGVLERVTFFAG